MPRWGDYDEVRVPAETEVEFAYFAGLLDGEGSFTVSLKTRVFGVVISMTDEIVIAWLHEHIGGKRYDGGLTPNRKRRVFRWILQRHSDLIYVLNRALPYLVLKRPQAEAMIALIHHLQDKPRWVRPTAAYSQDGKGGKERERRRAIWLKWREEEQQLRLAIRNSHARR